MQDVHSIGGGGRFFGGGGGDRRLRPHHLHHENHQALKCPRCDSLNTKFCYYNNYNLSQPRHFCKSCRRYWTKGGVLRNVPVGGGCRKAKRSKPAKSSSETPPVPPPPPAAEPKSSSSHSSSESSSLTASATAAATEAASAPSSSSAPVNLISVPEQKLYVSQSANPNFEAAALPELGSECAGIFSEIGSFTSLITSSNETLPFEFGNIPDVIPFRLNQQDDRVQNHGQPNQWQPQKLIGMGGELKIPEANSGTLDQTTQVDLSALQHRPSGLEFGSLDWPGGGEPRLLDISGAVDQAYWSQNQWPDHDHPSLYLP